jgi:hypothetical protein
MEQTNIAKYTISFGLSLALASVINALLVVAKEKVPAVMVGMQRLTGHHWISHSAIVLAVFTVGGWIFARSHGGQGMKMTANRLIITLVSGVSLGGLIILGFYFMGEL